MQCTVNDALSWFMCLGFGVVFYLAGLRIKRYIHMMDQVWHVPKGVFEVDSEYVCQNIKKHIKKVKLSDDVVRIGEDAFSFLSALKVVHLGCGVVVIEDGAFCYCRELESIQIKEGTCQIGDCAFSYCSKLHEMVIANSVKKIGNDAFKGCDSLKTLVLPDAFFSANKETKQSHKERLCIGKQTKLVRWTDYAIEISKKIKQRDVYMAFQIWHIPKGIIEVNCEYVCQNIKKHIKKVSISDDVVRIGEDAFSFAKGLKKVSLGHGVFVIEEGAFYCCRELENVDIEEGIYQIGNAAFSNCSKLSKMVIANSVEKIGNEAFKGCDSLKTLTLPDAFFLDGEQSLEDHKKRLCIGDQVAVIKWTEHANGILQKMRQ